MRSLLSKEHSSLPTADPHHCQLAADLSTGRIINGMWQVSGSHGTIVPQKAIAAMISYFDAGLTTWDLADHYGPAEDFVGALRRKILADRGEAAANQIKALTKWVPRPGVMSPTTVANSVKVAMRRMQVSTIDLMQFHWWDYNDDRYLDALKNLADLQAAGKIKHLGLTNFDPKHLQIVLDAGIPIVSNQVQFSLIDSRPAISMTQLCQERGVKLFAYGTLCGGMLSEKYLGQANMGRFQLNTASLRKYKNMIEAWGGWPLFQELLAVLAIVAKKHQVSIANVAVRYVIEQPIVAGAIVGARLGVSQHITDNQRVFEFALDDDDLSQIQAVCGRSNDLLTAIGDCGDEYRN
jgi:aryl-alcohol dehydrogenase-like predicted oxidoreductase